MLTLLQRIDLLTQEICYSNYLGNKEPKSAKRFKTQLLGNSEYVVVKGTNLYLKPIGTSIFIVWPPVFSFYAIGIFGKFCFSRGSFRQAGSAGLGFFYHPFNKACLSFAFNGEHYPVAKVNNPAVRLGSDFCFFFNSCGFHRKSSSKGKIENYREAA